MIFDFFFSKTEGRSRGGALVRMVGLFAIMSVLVLAGCRTGAMATDGAQDKPANNAESAEVEQIGEDSDNGELEATFHQSGCAGECADCHSLSIEEATELLQPERVDATVVNVKESPIKGLWAVILTQNDKNVVALIDYSKKFMVQGKLFSLSTLKNKAAGQRLNKVEISRIKTDDAIVMGNPDAEVKIIVFDDPDCPFCSKFHAEIKKILEQRDDVAFYLKMYPLPIHPNAYEKSKTIYCERSVELLEDAYAGKDIPPAPADCDASAVDENIQLAQELGITGTPAIVFPDGTHIPGHMPAENFIMLLEQFIATGDVTGGRH